MKKILFSLLFVLGLVSIIQPVHAVEYYTFEFEIIDVSDINDVEYTPLTLYDDLKSFILQYGYNYNLSIVFDIDNDQKITYDTINDNVVYINYDLEYDFDISNDFIMSTDKQAGIIPLGSYTLITDIPIPFIQTWWDNIVNAINEATLALSAAASAGVDLIYDGTGLTTLGSVLVIPIGAGLVLGVFYLIIRLLPSVRL